MEQPTSLLRATGLAVILFASQTSTHAQSFNSAASACPPGMTLTRGAAGQSKCIGTPKWGIPASGFNINTAPIADVQRLYEQGATNPIAATGNILTDNMRRDPSPTDPYRLTTTAQIGSAEWRGPTGVSILPDGSPVGSNVIGSTNGASIVEVSEVQGGYTVKTTCAVPTDPGLERSLAETYRVALPFFTSMRASNGMPYCTPSHWNGASGQLTQATIETNSFSQGGQPSQPLMVNNYFGSAACWNLDQLRADPSSSNQAIVAEVVKANRGGLDFLYCTKPDGTSPHLFNQAENRTCLPTSADSACHARTPVAFNMNNSLATFQNEYQLPGVQYNSAGNAVVNNFSLFGGGSQATIAPGSPGWTPPAGSRLNPTGVLGTRDVGVNNEARFVEVTEDVAGVRLTTACAIPTAPHLRNSLSDTYKIALPIFQQMRASNGGNYCSPSMW